MKGNLIESFRLSPLQRHLCALQQLEEPFPFRVHYTVYLEGRLDVSRLHRALEQLVERYEILRTRFPYQPDSRLPTQVIDTSYVSLPLVIHDCSALAPDKQQTVLQQLREGALDQALPLHEGPWWQMTVITSAAQQHWLFWNLSALCADMQTGEVLLRELSRLYEQDADAVDPLQYADLTEWQYELLEAEETAKGRDYWHALKPGLLQSVSLPYTKQLADRSLSFVPCALSMHVSSMELGQLRLLAQSLAVTPATVLLACWGIVLSRLSEQSALTIGTGYSGRTYEELAGAVGLLARYLPLSYQFAEDSRLSDTVLQLEATIRDAADWQEYFDWSLFAASEGEEPFSPFGFNYETVPLPWQMESLNWSIKEWKGCLDRFNLCLSCLEAPQDVQVTLYYDANRFVREDMQRLLTHWQTVLRQVLASSDVVLGSLQLLNQEEQRLLLEEWNFSQHALVGEAPGIHQMFEQQVESTPDAIAIVLGEEALTYSALNKRANRLAHYLHGLGIGPDDLVGLYMDRSIEIVVGLLGVLKAGAAYVPLDTSTPYERLSVLLEDIGASAFLTSGHLPGSLFEEKDMPLICLDNDWEMIAKHDASNLLCQISPSHLAYMIYTSGSTGRPKGVLITHANIVHSTQARFISYDEPVRDFLLLSPFFFDSSVAGLYWTLCQGGRLVLPEEDFRADLLHLSQLIMQQHISHLLCIPSLYALILDQAVPEQLASLLTVIVAGEACPVSLVRRHQEVVPQARLYNEYGPTEGTVWSSVYRCQFQRHEAVVPIGRPIPNVQMYLLDQRLRLAPIGVVGEVYIGGAGLARGYLKRPELTAERFIPHPWATLPGERLYRTGDLARYRSTGELEYLGRVDQQVKVRGYRIELGEIEAILQLHEDGPGDKRLVAYIVIRQGQVLPTTAVRAYLQDRLPIYMIPAVFVRLAALPLTSNGKVDRKKLPVPDEVLFLSAETFVGPRTDVEEILASIWSQVLHVEKVSIHDNFFALGGDSILSIQIVSRAKLAGLHITPKQLFQYQSIAQLASVVTHTSTVHAEQELVTGSVPLTPIQHWFFVRHLPEPHHYNQSVLLETQQLLLPSWIHKALAYLVLHHDALRLRFLQQADGWLQDIAGTPSDFRFPCIDLSALSAAQQELTQAALSEEAQASIDLSSGLLLRALFFMHGAGRTDSLLLIIHHLAVDGVSWRILLEDLEMLCQQQRQGEQMCLIDKTTSWRKWAYQLQAYAQTEAIRAEQSYWFALKERPITPLPIDMAWEDNTLASRETVSVSLDAKWTQALLQDVHSAYHTQINDLLLTALVQAFATWTGQQRLLIDMEGHGREEFSEEVDISRTIGWFTTLFPVLLDIEQATKPGEALKAVKEQLRQIPQKGLSYGLLRYLSTDSQVAKQFADLPRAEVVFNYLGQFNSASDEKRLFRYGQASTGSAHSKSEPRDHLLEINGSIVQGELAFFWRYGSHIHHRDTIQRLAQSFIVCLENLITHCQTLETSEYTPSDFPLAALNQRQLDGLIQQVSQAGQRNLLIEDIYPLSSMQAGLLFHSLYAPDSGVYCLQFGWTIQGSLDVEAWRWAWQQVVARHSILRTFFVWQGLSEPLQIVCRHVDVPCDIYDWSLLSAQEQQQRLNALVQEKELKSSDLGHAPLLRLALVYLGEQTYQFYLSWHHLIIDGWSQSLILAEVQQFYMAACEKKAFELASVHPYRDYIAWVRAQDMRLAERFWRSYLSGFMTPNRLPGHEGASDAAGQQMTLQQLACPTGLTVALQEVAQKLQITLNTLLQGTWALLLSHYSGDEDILFGATTTGRPPELVGGEAMVGVFINTLPVRIRVPSDTLLPDWLRQIQVEQVEARQYEYTPLSQIQAWSEVQSGQSLFETLLVFQNYPSAASVLEQSDALEIRRSLTVEQTHYPIMVRIVPTKESLIIFLHYDEARFEAAMITRMLQQLQALLQAIVDQPDQRPADFSLLSAEELSRLLIDWNATEAFYPEDLCIHQLFEQQVERTPERIAVVFEDEQLTYRKLDQRANQLAHYLQLQGVGPDVFVGVCVGNSIEMAISVLAILKAGGAVVPIDPAYPKERLSFMLADAHVTVLLTQASLLGYLPASQAQIVLLDSVWEVIAQQSTAKPASTVMAEHLMYVIYTSGSTGTPKGVSLPHRALVNLLTWHQTNLCGQVRTLQYASLSFDASFHEMFAAWNSGGTLCIITSAMRRDVVALVSFLVMMDIEKMILPVVLLQQLAEECTRRKRWLTGVKEITATGEQLQITQPLVEMFKTLTNCTLHNHYGPSESHVVTAYQLAGSPTRWPTHPPIGRPIANTQIYVLDKHLKPVPIGVVGELYIGGVNLARGYLDRPAMTAERFIPNPFARRTSEVSSQGGERLYKTGDLVRYRADGVIEFLGRRDHQVKIRGYRVELGEIESLLNQHAGVDEVVVLARKDAVGDKRLVAYVVLSQEQQITSADLRRYLQAILPDYMVPSSFVVLDKLPLTPNGKVDHRALPEPDSVRPELEVPFIPPRTPAEEVVAAIWAEIIGVEQVGVYDNFFGLGGHSLRAVQVTSRLCDAFQIELPLRSLFEKPTVDELVNEIAELRGGREIVEEIALVLKEIEQLSDETAREMLYN
jgi:amino acid adenylation domain-containing protein/non-ribosomal peptide synthase protein (TIGR01720 family)